jgi:protein ImuB
MERRIASLWFARLASDRLWLETGRRLPGPARRQRGRQRQPAEEAPLAIVGESGGRRFLTAVNVAAERAGLAPGLPLASARAVCPGLVTRPADPTADRALLHRLARLAERFTPLVGIDGADGLALDVGGSAHLFGGEAALLAALVDRFAGLGLAVAAALADTGPAARAIARFGGGARLVPPGETAAHLAPLPAAALGLDQATTADLARLGLKRVGDLYPLPRAALATRFGPGLLAALDRALGRQPSPLAPLTFAAPYRVRLGFAEPIAGRAVIIAALDRALDRLCRRLARDGRGSRRLRCRLHRQGAPPVVLEIGTARPCRSPAELARLLALRLEATADVGRGAAGDAVEALTIEAAWTEPLVPVAAGSLPLTVRAGAAAAATATGGADGRMAGLIDRLGNRLGFARVLAFAPRPGHQPERAFATLAGGEEGGKGGDWPAPPAPRPLRLLARPEPLVVLALRPPGSPADPPARFRRGRTEHRVAAATGPERIAWAWWRDDPDWRETVRDYWRIEDDAGRRLWLFRRIDAGGGGASAAAWFLHGIFP